MLYELRGLQASRWFSFRRRSHGGHPCAQPAYDALVREGQSAMLIGWENYKGRAPRIYAETLGLHAAEARARPRSR